MSSIQIDSEAVRALVAKGIVESIGADQRQLVIQQAVEALMTPPKDSYGRAGESPLQTAFNRAVQAAAQKVVTELVAEDEVKAQVDAALRAKMAQLLTDDYNLTSVIAEAIGKRAQQIIDSR